MKRFAWVALFVFAACASGSRMMTVESFYDIPVGATREEVITQAGQPYRVMRKEDGVEEFEYIERMSAGNLLNNGGPRILQERHYILTLRDGRVVSKRVEFQSPSPTKFDSYEMQTTQNEEAILPD